MPIGTKKWNEKKLTKNNYVAKPLFFLTYNLNTFLLSYVEGNEKKVEMIIEEK